MPKKCLVTGGAGFIGSHFCEILISRGFSVICLDNLSTGRIGNISGLLGHPEFSFIEQNVTSKIDLDCDYIVNLACPASPVHYQADPVDTVRTNVLGMYSVLDCAASCGAIVLQASTSEVYGDPIVHPQHEGYWGNVNPIGVRSCYDEGKRCAETLCFDFNRQLKVPVKVARIFNTFGPRMDCNDGRVVSNFIVQALCDKPLTVYGDGDQTRSFCFVDDLADGLFRLLETPQNYTGPVNLGNPSEMTVKSLAEKVINMCNSNSLIEYRDLPSDDPRQRQPDIGKAMRDLEWSPRVSLTDGLAATIAYFKEMLA